MYGVPAVSAWSSYFWRISSRGGSKSAGEGDENCCQEKILLANACLAVVHGKKWYLFLGDHAYYQFATVAKH
jgi:hypothetical protein